MITLYNQNIKRGKEICAENLFLATLGIKFITCYIVTATETTIVSPRP